MTVKPKDATPLKTKTGRTNQRAILATPEKFTGELPEKKKGGRKSKLTPIIEALKESPGVWHIVAKGKRATVYQTRVRLAALSPELEVETRSENADDATCYARMPAE